MGKTASEGLVAIYNKIVISPTDVVEERFAEHATRFINPVLLQTAELTQAFIKNYMGQISGIPIYLPEMNAEALYDQMRNGTELSEVYKRPIKTLRETLHDHQPWAEALKAGAERAKVSFETDVQLASTVAAHEVLTANDQIVGYVRVPNAGACPLCLLASTQRYHSGQLMPIHPRCFCSVAPITGRHDPGQIINKPLLHDLKSGNGISITKRLADGTHKTYHYSNDDVAVHHHGELGPILTYKKDHFTGPSQVKDK